MAEVGLVAVIALPTPGGKRDAGVVESPNVHAPAAADKLHFALFVHPPLKAVDIPGGISAVADCQYSCQESGSSISDVMSHFCRHGVKARFATWLARSGRGSLPSASIQRRSKTSQSRGVSRTCRKPGSQGRLAQGPIGPKKLAQSCSG